MKTLLTTLAVLALLIAPAQAAQLTPTLSYDNTDLTTGTTRTISVTVTGSGSAATISSLSLSSSCLTVSDPSGGSYSSFSAATGGTTKDFVVTSGTAATCTFTASSLEQSQNSPSTSSEGTLVFVNPSAIGVTVDADAAGSYASGRNYTFTVTLVNSLNSTVSVGYNITKGSQTTKQTGDVTNDTITMTAGASSQLNWSFSSTSTDTLTFYVGTRLAHTAAVTISAADSGSSTTSGGGGGGASTASAATKVSFAIDKVVPGTMVTKSVSSAAIPITLLKFDVSQQALAVTLDVTALSSKPSSVSAVPAGQTVYQFIEITKNIDDAIINSAAMTFTVNSSWITANSIDKNKVSLLRYNSGAWNKHPATLVSVGADSITYTATIPGFSVFSITGEKAVTPTTTPTTTAAPTTTATPVAVTTPRTVVTEGPVAPQQTDIFLWLVIGIIIVVIIAAVVMVKARV